MASGTIGNLFAPKMVSVGNFTLSANAVDNIIIPNTTNVDHYMIIPFIADYSSSVIRNVFLTAMITSSGWQVVAKNTSSSTVTVPVSAWMIYVS